MVTRHLTPIFMLMSQVVCPGTVRLWQLPDMESGHFFDPVTRLTSDPVTLFHVFLLAYTSSSDC
jgi:hypothetical protein